ncbi:MAG: ATP-binding cassette domain-containing protein [Candidatus Sungbacteria bacterium]|nr:ATP-binding cassette domain-containing protein [Candidatus Sungbacteria bacterium]
MLYFTVPVAFPGLITGSIVGLGEGWEAIVGAEIIGVTPGAAVTVKNLSPTFVGEDGKKTEALRDVSFSVRSGEFFTILGPSGCGKSTLLRIIAGMARPSHGDISFADPKMEKRMSMIFQSFAIFPWLTVYENVDFGLKMNGMPESERAPIVHEHIEEMALTGFEKSYPKDLSGGMRQRVGIARALSMNPSILLMDEAFSSLDAFTAERLRKDLLALWLKDRMTIIMVTHLVDEAIEMSDRILVMTPRPGMVEATVEISLARSRDKRSKEFFGLVDRVNELVKI